jgi:hypothetical protein
MTQRKQYKNLFLIKIATERETKWRLSRAPSHFYFVKTYQRMITSFTKKNDPDLESKFRKQKT